MKKKQVEENVLLDKVKQVEEEKKKKQLAIRKARITKEKNKLYKLFDSNNPEKKHLINRLIDRAAFLLVLSEDMETDIKEENLTVLTVNSSQSFIKANPLLKDYRDTVKSYQTVLKQLIDLIKNETTNTDEPDELEEFLKR